MAKNHHRHISAAAATMALALAVVLAACSTDTLEDPAAPQPGTATGGGGEEPAAVAVAFSATTTEGQPSTRGGAVATRSNQDEIIGGLSDLQNNCKYFGVYAYYQDRRKWADYDTDALRRELVPNFMCNQQVEWDGTEWTYRPVKYWPNEWSPNLEGGATTTGGDDRLSFFAYAPYLPDDRLPDDPDASVVSADGTRTYLHTGIVSLSGPDDAGAPAVGYRCPRSGTGPDLLWGVAREGYTSRLLTVGGTATGDVAAGFPFIDLLKPQVASQEVPFHFHHALGQFAVTIALADNYAHYDPADTRIMVEEVQVFAAKADDPDDPEADTADPTAALFRTRGTLSLLNSEADTPQWTVSQSDDERLTAYTFATGDVQPTLAYAAPTATQPDPFAAQAGRQGVTHERQPLTLSYRGALFIPSQGADFRVRLRYAIVRRDASGKGSVTHHTLTSDLISGMSIEAGRTTTLNITLHSTDLLVLLTVMPWVDDTASLGDDSHGQAEVQ